MLSLEQRRRRDELQREIRAIERTGHNPKKVRHRRAEPTAPGQRDPRKVIKDHKGAVANLFCLATYIRTGQEVYDVEVAHQRFSHAATGVSNPGMGRKSHDWRVLPLCHAEHQHRQHLVNEVAYWRDLGLDEAAVADLQRRLYAVTGDHEAMLDVLRSTRPTPRQDTDHA